MLIILNKMYEFNTVSKMLAIDLQIAGKFNQIFSKLASTVFHINPIKLADIK